MAINVQLNNALIDQARQGEFGTNAFSLQTITAADIAAAPPSSVGPLYGLLGGFGPQPGKAAVISGFYISCTEDARFYVRVGVGTGPLANANIAEYSMTFVLQKGVHYIKSEVTLRNGQSVIPYITGYPAGATTALVAFAGDVKYITDDFNYAARNTICWVGTSITNGTGPTSTAYMYHTLFKEELRRRGKSVRNELYGMSGSNTATHYTKFMKGDYDMTMQGKAPNVLIIELAVNDASSPPSGTLYQDRLSAYATRFLANPENKRIPVLILGGTPLENTANWNNLITLDNAAEAMVAELQETYPGRVFWVKLRDSYTRTNAAKYATSDTAGSRIHPNDSGQADIGATLIAWLDTEEGQTFFNSIP